MPVTTSRERSRANRNSSSNLQAAMKRTGLGNKELHEATGFTPASISNWTHGIHVPDAETLVLLSQVLGEPVDYLLGANTAGFTPARIFARKREYRDMR